MGQERKHRRYSPSQTERFSNCYGSTNLLKRVPARLPSPYAVEGTIAHEVLECGLRNGARDAVTAHREHSPYCFEDLDDGNNEFYLSVQSALNYVYSILDEHPDAQMHLERFVDPPVQSAPGEAGGYCDIAIYIPSQRLLFVIDYKHGQGVAKDVKGNRQAMQYAAGFLYEANPTVPPEGVDTVTLVIVQPRAFHPEGSPREHNITPFELWEFLQDLDVWIAENEKPDAPLMPDDTVQCRFCDARTLCPAREAQAVQVAGQAYQQIGQVRPAELPAPSALDMNRLATIRHHAPALRKWLDDVDAHCEELARCGHYVPGAKLVETQARREYYGEEREVVRKLAAMAGERDADAAMAALDDVFKHYPVLRTVYKFKPIPITSAEKLVVEAYKARVGRGRKKKAAEEARQSFAYLTLKKSSGNLTLVDESDPRQAVNRTQDTFGQVQGLIAPPKQG